MTSPVLRIIQPDHSPRQVEVSEDLISIGRATDNTICLQDDTNVSRYHAEIERRAEEFFLIDLGSSNGTTVNDQPVEFECKLQDGDLISIGGSTVIDFQYQAPTPAQAKPPSVGAEPGGSEGLPAANEGAHAADLANAVSAIQPPTPVVASSSGPPVTLIIGGIAAGLVLTALAAVVIVAIKSRGSCSASAEITSPQTGTTLRGPTPIRLNVQGATCIDRVIYQIDGTEVASVETSPYEVVLDPAQLRSIGPGNHTLSVAILDTDGNTRLEGSVLVAFESGTAGGPSPSVDGSPVVDSSPQITIQDPSLDVRNLSDRLAGQISRKSGYVFDRDFVELIRNRSSEYRISGYSDRARRYRREINKAFRDQGLDPLLGYVLAMSRSKFNDNARGEGLGLWQIPFSVAQTQGYLAAGESEETLRDPRRSAEIAAAYTKALVSTFESTDDFMFAVACFGQPLNEAGQVRTQLATQAPDPIARRDFFKMVKLGVVKGDQVDRVVRFFAAGITAENPQAFGLPNEQPFSSLF